MADLQEIVDDLEAEIRRPISVEDRRWRLLAHSAQPDEADAVRRSSILTRETSPDVVAWLEGLGLQRARDLVDVPRNDDLGMTRRGCLPIRHGDVLLGFLWVIVGDRPLSDAERAGLARGGEEVAANLWARHRAADERRRRTLRAARRAARRAREDAARELAATLRWPERGTYAVAVCDGRRGRRRAPAPQPRGGRLRLDLERGRSSLTILRPRPRRSYRLRSKRCATGGVSAPFAQLAARAGRRCAQAEIAALVRPRAARRSGRSPPTTSSAAGR